MSRSVFAKYVMAFTALLLCGFLMLLLIFNSVVTSYSEQTKENIVKGAAQAAAFDLSDMYAESGETDFPAYIEGNKGYLVRLFEAVRTNSDDIMICVTDMEGQGLLSAGPNAVSETAVANSTDTPVSDMQLQNFSYDEQSLASVLHPQEDGVPVILSDGKSGAPCCAMAVRDAKGDAVGTVVVLATSGGWSNLGEFMSHSVAVAAVWIMIAALIALYFITERIIAPLRQMSRAAKRMAVGEFDTRIQVKGHDEVAELATAFNQMSESLENLEQMRNSFVANVSHDLRTPMTTIAGFIDGILDGVIPPEEQEHYLRVVSDEVHRLSRLVNQLLELSRFQAGYRKLDKKPFDLCELGRQILISLEQKIEEKELDVSFACDEDRMYVLGDRDAIHQVLYNICDNAVKFSSPGGKLSISFTRTAGDGLGQWARKVQASVYNEGQGIPPEDIPFIFDRFYKGDKSRSMDRSGVGLGMYIAKAVMDAHGESISVTSEYGKNCCFSFTLPRKSPPTRPSEQSGQSDK